MIDPVLDAPVRVLLVDDSPADRALTEAHLEEVRGLRLDVTAVGSAAALRELRAVGGWDVYLLDHRLGDATGLDLAREILAEEDAVVMLLTGEDDEALDEAAESIGVSDYLLKDRVDADRLGRALRYGLRSRRDRGALRAGREELEQAQTIAGVGSWRWDVADDEVRWSAELCRMWGMEPTTDPIDFDAYLARVHPDDRGRAQATIQQALAHGGAYTIEHRIVLPDGGERIIEGRGDVERGPDGLPQVVHGVSRDVTSSRRAAARLQEAQERFRAAFDQSPIGMALATLDGRPLQVNAALARIAGRDASELLATTLDELTHPDDRAAAAARLGALVSGQLEHVEAEQRLVGAGGGRPVWVEVHETLVRDGNGSPRHRLLQVQDITDRRRFEDQLQHMADHDPLTGLLNRRAFQNELEQQVERTRRYGGQAALIMLDLDQFKAINDTLGHSAGDELIIETAARLRERLRVSDVLARLGGDEFAILLPQTSPEAAEHVAGSLLETLRRTRVGSRRVTGSIGVVMLDQSSGSADGLLVNADLAMYDAKESGRDRLSVYRAGEGSEPRIQRRLTWLERIERGLDENRFVLFAQPIADVATGAVEQHELLVRLMTADGELVPPATFLDVAERFDLVQRIDRLVMVKAVELIAHHQAAGRRVPLSVNLSGRTLGEPGFLGALEAALSEHRIDASLLSFELTETAAVANMPAARRFADRLHELGCRFALDDFGAGFGSFSYLKHLPFDYLKIDGEFVRQCTSVLADQLVIRALVGIAQGLGVRTVGEFTEDAATLDFLRAMGVDLAQGYHIGRPMPVDEALGVGEPSGAPAG